mmetsp:Transcript_27712/g.79974  ORF Transcript_27712/g.79974 Transcript_27712/m.79974 type:complete len:213 (-) Transcript_27712:1418-2056(-)
MLHGTATQWTHAPKCSEPLRLELELALVGGRLELREGLAAQSAAVLGRNGHVPPDLGEAHGLPPFSSLGQVIGGGGCGCGVGGMGGLGGCCLCLGHLGLLLVGGRRSSSVGLDGPGGGGQGVGRRVRRHGQDPLGPEQALEGLLFVVADSDGRRLPSCLGGGRSRLGRSRSGSGGCLGVGGGGWCVEGGNLLVVEAVPPAQGLHLLGLEVPR